MFTTDDEQHYVKMITEADKPYNRSCSVISATLIIYQEIISIEMLLVKPADAAEAILKTNIRLQHLIKELTEAKNKTVSKLL